MPFWFAQHAHSLSQYPYQSDWSLGDLATVIETKDNVV